jgi:hypothetical protein
MGIPYSAFTGAFLNKISEFELLQLDGNNRTEVIDGYRKRAVSAFKKNCRVDLLTTADDDERVYNVEVAEEDLDELVDIISEGMVVQWLKPYVYQQDLLQNLMNTRDYSMYSPAELLMRVGNAYQKAQRDYTQMIREYSYNHGDLSELHL